MNGLLYGSLCLSTLDKSSPIAEVLNVDFRSTNNHIYPFEDSIPKRLDYLLAASSAENLKLFVPVRGMTFTGLRVGESSEESKESLKASIRNILAMNTRLLDEDSKDNSFLSLVYEKSYLKLTTRSFLTIDMKCSQPKIIIMTQGVPVYFFSLVVKDAAFLIWTNEQTLEARLKEHFGNSIFFYRMPVLENGVRVIQTRFLEKRVKHWYTVLKDKLLVMNALEALLQRKTLTLGQTDL